MLRKMLWLTACMLSAIAGVSAREKPVPACEIPLSAREVFVRDTFVQSSPDLGHEAVLKQCSALWWAVTCCFPPGCTGVFPVVKRHFTRSKAVLYP